MAITTYDELKTAIRNWSNRGDLSTISSDLITLAEARMNRDLLISERITEDSGTVADPVVVPADYWSPKEMVISRGGGETVLRMVSLEEFSMHKDSGGYAAVFAEYQGGLIVAPTATGDYILRYYAKIPALSDSNTTNWLLTKYPDLYLWASLAETGVYINSDGRAGMYEGKYQQALAAIMLDDEKRRFGGSILRQRAVV